MRRSLGSISMSTSSSSSSGITSRLAKDVWRRRDASKGEIRTSRCTPRSADSRPYAWGPERMNVALLIPASSPGSTSSSSTRKPRRSAHRRYIRRSISAQSWDSVPPAPAWMLATASLSSYSPPRSEASSNRSTSCSSAASDFASSPESSGSSSWVRSSSMARASSRRRTRESYRSTAAFRRARRVVSSWPRAGSSHTDGSVASASRSAACRRLASTSKVLLRRRDPFGQLLDPLRLRAHGPDMVPASSSVAAWSVAAWSPGGVALLVVVGVRRHGPGGGPQPFELRLHPGPGGFVAGPVGHLEGPPQQLDRQGPLQVVQGPSRVVAPVVVQGEELEAVLQRVRVGLLVRVGGPAVQDPTVGRCQRGERGVLEQPV